MCTATLESQALISVIVQSDTQVLRGTIDQVQTASRWDVGIKLITKLWMSGLKTNRFRVLASAGQVRKRAEQQCLHRRLRYFGNLF